MSPQSLADDLAYIRDLAQAGQKAPLLGGRFLAWWGGLTTLAYAGHYAIAEGLFGLPPIAFLFMWTGYILLGIGGSVAMQKSFSPNMPGAASTGNRVSALVWKASGYFLGTFFFGAFLRAVLSDAGADAFLWSVPMVLGVYGLAQFVAGTIGSSRPLILAGIAALGSVVPAVMLTGNNLVWLLGAVVAAGCVLLPGVILMRGEPSETV